MTVLIVIVVAFVIWGLGLLFLPVFEDIEGPGVFLLFSFALFVCTMLVVSNVARLSSD